MSRVVFEPMIPMFQWAKTVHALDRSATVIGRSRKYHRQTGQMNIDFGAGIGRIWLYPPDNEDEDNCSNNHKDDDVSGETSVVSQYLQLPKYT
jgi:hypothetical protein